MPDLWYAAYGSNLARDRFETYLSGGRPDGAARHYPGARDPSLVKRTVTVHVVPEGQLSVYHDKRPIAYRKVTKPSVKPPAAHRAKPQPPTAPPHAKATAERRAWLFAKQ